MFAVFSVKNFKADNGKPLSVEKIDIPLTEYLQEMEKDNPLKETMREIRKEIQLFLQYKFQWFQQIGSMIQNGKIVEKQFKNKSKDVFTSINTLAKEFMDINNPEIKTQKLNVINDMNKGHLVIILADKEGNIKLRSINTSSDKRTQIFDDSKLSRMNFQLHEIFQHQLTSTRYLSFSDKFHNIIRGY